MTVAAPGPGAAGAPGSGVEFAAFEAAHYDAARRLWLATPGVGLSAADERPAIESFLSRNPGLSRVGIDGSELVATILVGHDGRRGLIHHLAVAPAARRRGIGRGLVAAAVAGLAGVGIAKCHLMVFTDNADARAFWQSVGAEHRENLALYSLPTAA